jgi:hypothetical protein
MHLRTIFGQAYHNKIYARHKMLFQSFSDTEIISGRIQAKKSLGRMLWFWKYFRHKNWRFLLKLLIVFEKNDHNIGLWEKRQFFRRKLAKIGENCDNNNDPWSPEADTLS